MLPWGISWEALGRLLGASGAGLGRFFGESWAGLRGGILEAKNAPDLSETRAMLILFHFCNEMRTLRFQIIAKN